MEWQHNFHSTFLFSLSHNHSLYYACAPFNLNIFKQLTRAAHTLTWLWSLFKSLEATAEQLATWSSRWLFTILWPSHTRSYTAIQTKTIPTKSSNTSQLTTEQNHQHRQRRAGATIFFYCLPYFISLLYNLSICPQHDQTQPCFIHQNCRIVDGCATGMTCFLSDM